MMRFSIKFWLWVSICALLFEGMLALMGKQRLADARETNEVLAGEAKELGISLDSKFPEGPAFKKRRTSHRTVQEDPGKLAADLAEFVNSTDNDFRISNLSLMDVERLQSLIRRMRAAGPDSWHEIVHEMIASSNGGNGSEALGIVLYALIDVDPREVLELVFPLSGDLKGGAVVVQRSLAGWYMQDPVASMQWMKEQEKMHSALSMPSYKTEIISMVAAKDPGIAFALIRDFRMPSDLECLKRIASAVGTPELRLSALSELREFLPEIEEGKQMGAVGMFLNTMSFGDGNLPKPCPFESVGNWLDAANLSPDETLAFVKSLPPGGSLRDAGKWIDWIAKSSLPDHEKNDRIRLLALDWIEHDFRSAAEWLQTASEGAAKLAVNQAYAEKVILHDP